MWLKKGVCSLVAWVAVLALAPDAAQAEITITQLANEGVIISDGNTRVMIDGMVVEPYSVYGGLPADAEALFNQAGGPFSGIDLALASHRHHDHNQPKFACEFVRKSSETIFVSSSQVLGLMREKCRDLVTTSPRIREIDPQYGEPEIVEQEGVRVTVFLLSHGTYKYATIQNYGHLVEINGVSVLHIGDAAMTSEDFQTAGLDQLKVDVALIPFWFFQPGPGAAVVKQFLDATVQVAVHIPPGEMEEVQVYLAETCPSVLILDAALTVIHITAEQWRPRGPGNRWRVRRGGGSLAGRG
jgi:L-ascorbate metabolism protein UlaG (beta-lactamase superfamily)